MLGRVVGKYLMPLLTHNDKSIFFIHIPKTGGSSLYLKGNTVKPGITTSCFSVVDHDPCTPQHYHIDLLKERYPEYVKNQPFTILRDPWGRTCSEYAWQCKLRGGNPNWNNFEYWLSDLLQKYKVNPFVADNHIRPQIQFIDQHVKVFLQENYQDVVDYVEGFFGSDLNVKIKEKHISYTKPKFESLDKKLQNLWSDLYQQDLELYEKHSDSR